MASKIGTTTRSAKRCCGPLRWDWRGVHHRCQGSVDDGLWSSRDDDEERGPRGIGSGYCVKGEPSFLCEVWICRARGG